MKVRDRAVMTVSPALKSKVRPSQRKAPQALFHPRSCLELVDEFCKDIRGP